MSTSGDDSDVPGLFDPYEIPKEPRKKIAPFRGRARGSTKRTRKRDVFWMTTKTLVGLPSNYKELEAEFERIEQHELVTCLSYEYVRDSSISPKTPPPRDRKPETPEPEVRDSSSIPETFEDGQQSWSSAGRVEQGTFVEEKSYRKKVSRWLYDTEVPGTMNDRGDPQGPKIHSRSSSSLPQLDALSSGDDFQPSTSGLSSSTLTVTDVLTNRRERIKTSQSLLEDRRRGGTQKVVTGSFKRIKKASSLPERLSLVGPLTRVNVCSQKRHTSLPTALTKRAFTLSGILREAVDTENPLLNRPAESISDLNPPLSMARRMGQERMNLDYSEFQKYTFRGVEGSSDPRKSLKSATLKDVSPTQSLRSETPSEPGKDRTPRCVTSFWQSTPESIDLKRDSKGRFKSGLQNLDNARRDSSQNVDVEAPRPLLASIEEAEPSRSLEARNPTGPAGLEVASPSFHPRRSNLAKTTHQVPSGAGMVQRTPLGHFHMTSMGVVSTERGSSHSAGVSRMSVMGSSMQTRLVVRYGQGNHCLKERVLVSGAPSEIEALSNLSQSCASTSLSLVAPRDKSGAPTGPETTAGHTFAHLLGMCGQERPLTFEDALQLVDLTKCSKAGEGSHGDVFVVVREQERSVVKVIPIDVETANEPGSTASQGILELVICRYTKVPRHKDSL
ncbi:hypothetical protein ISCGN_007827 [Ixodes scapularis]